MKRKTQTFTEFFHVNPVRPKKGRKIRIYEESTVSQALTGSIESKSNGINMGRIWNNLISAIKLIPHILNYIRIRLALMMLRRSLRKLRFKGGQSAFK